MILGTVAASSMLSPWTDPENDKRLGGCGAPAVRVVSLAGCGRVLVATRAFAPREFVFRGKFDWRVEQPVKTLERADSLDGPIAQPRVEQDTPDVWRRGSVEAAFTARLKSHQRRDMLRAFDMVEAFHSESGDVWSSCDYWNALMSLTADEGPATAGTSWPCVSASEQQRMLMLYRPAEVFSHVPGKKYGVLALALCDHFALRVHPSKLIDLLKVWKFNSFQTTVEDGSSFAVLGLAISHMNHSCLPSGRISFRRFSYEADVFAEDAGLAAGDELTFNYLGVGCSDIRANDRARRQLLAMTWLFVCTCSKCIQGEENTCQRCGRIMMSPIMSCERSAGSVQASCGSCGREHLQRSLGFFYQCDGCNEAKCGYYCLGGV